MTSPLALVLVWLSCAPARAYVRLTILETRNCLQLSDMNGQAGEYESFEAGPHTYASWKPKENLYRGNDFIRNPDALVYVRNHVTRLESKRPYRDSGSDGYNDEENNFEEIYDDGQVNEREYEGDGFIGNNGIIEGLRKIYDALFFYGLDVPETRSRRRDRNRKRIKASGANKKNPFFTGSEAAAEEYFNSVDSGEEAFEQSRARSPSRGGRRTRGQEEEIKVESFEMERRLDEIDDLLESLSQSLKRVDLSITELRRRQEDGGGSGGAKKDLSLLEEKRVQLLGAIEEAQIEYVDLQASM